MSRRLRIWLIVLAIIAALFALSLRWIAQPDRVAAMVLSRAGTALGLEIIASGASEYRLLGTPMLAIRDVVARQPGTAIPLLRARRIYLTLPWSTIRAGGADLTVKRVELEAPQLDIAALQRWLATRPPSETKIPTLTEGLRIMDGQVIGDGWTVQALDLNLPSLYPDRRVRAQLSGRIDAGATRLPFDVHAALTKPAIDAGLGLSGQVSVESGDWKLSTIPTLSGRLHSGADGVGLHRMKLGAAARYVSGDSDLSFVFGIAGPLRYRESVLSIAPAGSVVHGDGPIPIFNAHGRIAFADALSLQLAGRLTAWPEAWPALPAPIGTSNSPLPFALDYTGKADFSDTASLRLQRDETRFAGRFRVPEIMAWIDAGTNASPLPPLDGWVTTPAMEVSGAQLQGVEVVIDEPSIAEPAVR